MKLQFTKLQEKMTHCFNQSYIANKTHTYNLRDVKATEVGALASCSRPIDLIFVQSGKFMSDS